jgi:hypothetical protein
MDHLRRSLVAPQAEADCVTRSRPSVAVYSGQQMTEKDKFVGKFMSHDWSQEPHAILDYLWSRTQDIFCEIERTPRFTEGPAESSLISLRARASMCRHLVTRANAVYELRRILA